MIIPRIRGKVFQKDNRKWTYYLEITELVSQAQEGYQFPLELNTREEAMRELTVACRKASEKIAEHLGYPLPDHYYDINANQTKFWDKRNEH